MTERFGHPKFYELIEQMAELHSRKNHDYSGTADPLKNLRSPLRIGISPFMGVLVRLQDKWSRLEQFANSGEMLVKGESVIDTLMDNAVYSLLAIILYEEMKENAEAAAFPQTPEAVPGYGGDVVTVKSCRNCKYRITNVVGPPCGKCFSYSEWEPADE
jgi:hypothetical protein